VSCVSSSEGLEEGVITVCGHHCLDLPWDVVLAERSGMPLDSYSIFSVVHWDFLGAKVSRLSKIKSTLLSIPLVVTSN